MNIPALGAAVLLLALAGWAAARALAPEATGPRRLARALILGPWALSLEGLGFGVLGLPLSLPALALPWLPAALWACRSSRAARRPNGRLRHGPAWLVAVPVGLTAIHALAAPFPSGDHLFNFAVHAKLFQAAGGFDFEALRSLPFPGHRDYPPLIPLAELPLLCADPLHGWRLLGAFGPAALAAFLLLTAEALRGARRSFWPRFALVLGTPILYQVPDLHPADLFAAAAGMLLLIEAKRCVAGDARSAFALAAAGSAAWLAKHEGLAFAAVAACVLAAATRGRRRALAGALVVVPSLAWLILQWSHGMPLPVRDPLSGAVAARGVEACGRLGAVVLQVTPLAWIPVAEPVQVQVPAFGLAFVVAACSCAAALCSSSTRRRSVLVMLGLALHLAFLAAGAAMRGENLAWLQATAFDRLGIQLLPWCVAALAVSTSPRGGLRGPGPTM